MPMNSEPMEDRNTSNRVAQDQEPQLAWREHSDRMFNESYEAYKRLCEDYQKKHGKPMPLPEIKS